MSHQKETTTECFLAFCEHRAKMEKKLRKPYKYAVTKNGNPL